MALGADTVLDIGQVTLLVDNESGTDYAHFRYTIFFLRLPYFIAIADFPTGIGQQLQVEAVFFDKGTMRITTVFTHPNDHGIQSVKTICQRGKLVGLDGAAGRVILGVKI